MATAKWTLQWDVMLIAVIKKQTGLMWAQHELKVKCFIDTVLATGFI